MFDAKKWMNNAGIPFRTSGKNISSGGWVGLNCIFCGDRSSHLGIAPNGMSYSCFRCGAKGHITKLIRSILQVPHSECKAIFERYSNVLSVDYYNVTNRERASVVQWDNPNFEKEMPSVFAQYLYDRRYVPSQIEELYGVKCCYLTGDFKYRLVIPIFQNGIIVTYIGRDITGKSNIKYKNLKDALKNRELIVKKVLDLLKLRIAPKIFYYFVTYYCSFKWMYILYF